MGPKPKREKNLKPFNKTKEEKNTKESKNFNETLKFTISLIFCGFPETEAQEFDILNGQDPPNYREITKAFNIIRPIIKQLAEDSAASESENMPINAVICIDASWDHRRDGRLLVFDAICIQNKKIIDFSIQVRSSAKRKGNTNVSPQAMEGLAFEEILPRLMSNQSIVELVKDGDVQLESMIISSGWKVKVTPDPNHLLKHFPDHFDKIVEPVKFMFRGICKKLLKQFKFILYSDSEKQQKYLEIQHMQNFILTQPFLKLGRAKEPHVWKYSNDINARNKLNEVINLCNTITSSFTRYHSTCLNECFHSLKARYVPKKFNLGNTADVRTYAAILHFNLGIKWLELIYDRLKLPNCNVQKLEEFVSKAHPLLKKISRNDDYYARKMKEEEEDEKNYHQYLEDIKNHIPIHS